MNDFDKVDRRLEKELRDIITFDWRDRMTEEISPPKIELIPIGIYNGVSLPDILIDDYGVVWIEVPNPEYDCEVIM